MCLCSSTKYINHSELKEKCWSLPERPVWGLSVSHHSRFSNRSKSKLWINAAGKSHYLYRHKHDGLHLLCLICDAGFWICDAGFWIWWCWFLDLWCWFLDLVMLVSGSGDAGFWIWFWRDDWSRPWSSERIGPVTPSLYCVSLSRLFPPDPGLGLSLLTFVFFLDPSVNVDWSFF